MYGERERRESESDLVFGDYFMPCDPFNGRQYVMLPANYYPRPEGEHSYHFWTDQWAVPLSEASSR